MSSYLAEPPFATFIIMLVSLLMAFISSLVNSRFVPREHREKLRALQHRIAALKREKDDNLKKAKSTDDKKLLKKARKQEKQLLQLQSQMASLSLRQMKVLPITMAMFFLVWLLLTGSILGVKLFESPFIGTGPVAYLPWISGKMNLNLFYWYLLCSFLFGSLFSRIFGLTGATE
jgi:uncharacterized membrane protein (DUF106 family)